jgi:hypothetical protein
MKISLLLFVLGIILIFVGYSHQLKPTCGPNSNIEFINEDVFNTMVKNNATKTFNQMNHKDTFLGGP